MKCIGRFNARVEKRKKNDDLMCYKCKMTLLVSRRLRYVKKNKIIITVSGSVRETKRPKEIASIIMNGHSLYVIIYYAWIKRECDDRRLIYWSLYVGSIKKKKNYARIVCTGLFFLLLNSAWICPSSARLHLAFGANCVLE